MTKNENACEAYDRKICIMKQTLRKVREFRRYGNLYFFIRNNAAFRRRRFLPLNRILVPSKLPRAAETVCVPIASVRASVPRP